MTGPECIVNVAELALLVGSTTCIAKSGRVSNLPQEPSNNWQNAVDGNLDTYAISDVFNPDAFIEANFDVKNTISTVRVVTRRDGLGSRILGCTVEVLDTTTRQVLWTSGTISGSVPTDYIYNWSVSIPPV